MSDIFRFEALGQTFAVDCPDEALGTLVETNWARMATEVLPPNSVETEERFEVRCESNAISILCPNNAEIECYGFGDFLHQLEQAVIIRLQLMRPDLLFVHAAVIEIDDRICLLIAESGGGKSTTTWALLHHGCRYISDELAPINLPTKRVFPYPRALSVKNVPPEPYGLLPHVVSTDHVMLIPTDELNCVRTASDYPIRAMIFLNYQADADKPEIREVSPGEASARVYANALNHLAHPNHGLDAAIDLARSVPSFRLQSAELSATCKLLRRTLRSVG